MMMLMLGGDDLMKPTDLVAVLTASFSVSQPAFRSLSESTSSVTYLVMARAWRLRQVIDPIFPDTAMDHSEAIAAGLGWARLHASRYHLGPSTGS
ncbi:hypothetical protein A5782_04920 [Mycobacterium sp. 852002-40037_SCH5390672]|nr:hypothetical protein A5782_04920 [Mycobacterium sp. 852002-40037_SCH5390672]